MKRTRLAAALILFLLTLPAAARAQEHATTEQDLEAVVTSHAEVLDAGPAEVPLESTEAGVDVLRRAEATFVLNAEDVKQLAVRPDRLDGALAGSDDAITIRTTTIIIGLLVLIVLLAI
ncbi:MAG: hypothetical protein E4H28_07085 [Gemmatimonadales bacterium]|nr:MAG: hypothetical protein E4H28_07085 [Gemmatimonadales bacterium]